MAAARCQFLIIVTIAALYALAAWLLFSAKSMGQWLQIVSVSFIFTLPCSLGALVCFLGYKLDKPSRFWAYGATALTMLLLVFLSWLFYMEALICALVAAPILMLMAFTGGWLMSLILKTTKRGQVSVTLFVLLPYAVSPVEQLWQTPHEIRVMQNTITIHATPERVWNHIYEVPPRPGRSEPRVCKDRQNKYTFMTKPRHLFNLEDNLAHVS
jgi:hypothetical protein